MWNPPKRSLIMSRKRKQARKFLPWNVKIWHSEATSQRIHKQIFFPSMPLVVCIECTKKKVPKSPGNEPKICSFPQATYDPTCSFLYYSATASVLAHVFLSSPLPSCFTLLPFSFATSIFSFRWNPSDQQTEMGAVRVSLSLWTVSVIESPLPPWYHLVPTYSASHCSWAVACCLRTGLQTPCILKLTHRGWRDWLSSTDSGTVRDHSLLIFVVPFYESYL